MIEVLFGESEAGAMRVAKSNNIQDINKGPTSIIGKERYMSKQKIKWISGKSEEVICLGFLLDIGNIKESVDSPYRKNLIFSMFYQEQWGNDAEMAEELKQTGNFYVEELKRLEKYLNQDETVRIWYSDSPYAKCGLYFLCNRMRKYENPIVVVKLPEYKVIHNGIILCHNWGDIAAEEFSEFLQYERTLSREERMMYGQLWTKLVEENAPLRTIINGKIISVEEEFYDFFIWKRLTDKPIKQARLIGDILGYYPISIGDWWYAARIEKFIQQGRIRILEDSDNKYARTICLA